MVALAQEELLICTARQETTSSGDTDIQSGQHRHTSFALPCRLTRSLSGREYSGNVYGGLVRRPYCENSGCTWEKWILGRLQHVALVNIDVKK